MNDTGRASTVTLSTVAICAAVVSASLAVVAATTTTPEPCCPDVQTVAENRAAPTTTAVATRTAGLPACLVGSWRTVDEVFMIKFYNNEDPMRFTGHGQQYVFHPDGTGTETEDNVTLTGAFRGNELRLVINGTAAFTWAADGSRITYIGFTSDNRTYSYYDERGFRGTQPAPSRPNLNEVDDYSCGGTTMRESNSNGYGSSWVRTNDFGVYGG
ncbi:hypothetical protein ACFQ1S_22455 [Kibdelosporangium lantanae]|uniref:Uncharacterized protein n=1 Tax=Kibdelosporangium lantanae TaxID=1497396 RepID=A0ABW3MD93_9PSEU